jgi:hypothetical protein
LHAFHKLGHGRSLWGSVNFKRFPSLFSSRSWPDFMVSFILKAFFALFVIHLINKLGKGCILISENVFSVQPLSPNQPLRAVMFGKHVPKAEIRPNMTFLRKNRCMFHA